ncbi:MAG: MBL fold metallo-hydrolase, partial [Prochloron sp. SP5CPC1]|nr:MBL fold metallo-hydrolase [Candidatus Paraprochloron terpiosi SP5CPC1]
MAIAAAFLIAWMQMSPVALAEGKDAEQPTIDANEEVLNTLNFDNIDDFDLATEGFIDKLDPALIPQESGSFWNLEWYQFLLEGESNPWRPKGMLPPPPDTVNPSLWRQAQLNMQHGLYEVVPGIYQLRGYDLSVMTLVEGDTGWILIDPLLSNETAAAALDLANTNITEMNLPKHPFRRQPLDVSAVIYTHSHTDHFAGIKGIVEPEEIQSTSNPNGIPIYAPEG